MPNWCSNTVVFTGKIENLKAFLLNVYSSTKGVVEEEFNCKLHSENEMYCFDITCNEIDISELTPEAINNFNDTQLVLNYSTRWNPNSYDVLHAAKVYNLDFEHEYEETSMGIFGKRTFVYNEDEYCGADLKPNDFIKCQDEDGISDYEQLEKRLSQKMLYPLLH